MTPDSRRSSHKPLPSRPLHVPEEPTIRDLRTESPVKRVLPWMGFILFCTGTVFQAGRLVERLDPQLQPKPALLTGLLAADVASSAPGTASATPEPHEQGPEKQRAEADAEAVRKLMAERDQAQENARVAWQKQVEAEVAARIARVQEESSQQKQLEADELAQKAMQAAAEAEAKARALEIELATKTSELQEARLRAENEWLRAELERARASTRERQEPARVAETEAGASADSPGSELGSEPLSPSPAAVVEPPASPEPAQPSSEQSPAPVQATPP